MKRRKPATRTAPTSTTTERQSKKAAKQYKQNSIIEKKDINSQNRLSRRSAFMHSLRWVVFSSVIYMRYIYVLPRLPLSYIPYTEHRITFGAQTCVFFLRECFERWLLRQKTEYHHRDFVHFFLQFLISNFWCRSTVHLFHFSLFWGSSFYWRALLNGSSKDGSRQAEWVRYACTLIYLPK